MYLIFWLTISKDSSLYCHFVGLKTLISLWYHCLVSSQSLTWDWYFLKYAFELYTNMAIFITFNHLHFSHGYYQYPLNSFPESIICPLLSLLPTSVSMMLIQYIWKYIWMCKEIIIISFYCCDMLVIIKIKKSGSSMSERIG